MRVFALYNIKGGVGKTATAVNLAYLSAAAGARTLIWDVDPQGAASFYFRVRPKVRGGARKLIRAKRQIERFIRGTDFEGLDILPADFSNRNLDLTLDSLRKPTKRIARLLGPLREMYDHVYVDCAPSISLVSEGIFVAADALLVPTIPTPLSMRTLEQLARHLSADGPKKLRVRPFFCMVDRRRTIHRTSAALAAQSPYPFLRTSIPYSSVVEQMGLYRAPVALFARGSEAALAYESLWREALNEFDSWAGWAAMELPPDIDEGIAAKRPVKVRTPRRDGAERGGLARRAGDARGDAP